MTPTVDSSQPQPAQTTAASPTPSDAADAPTEIEVEIGGPKGPEPTRFGDWERNGRCSDF